MTWLCFTSSYLVSKYFSKIWTTYNSYNKAKRLYPLSLNKGLEFKLAGGLRRMRLRNWGSEG